MRSASALAAVLFPLASVGAAQAHPWNEVRQGSLPSWAREAMALSLPATDADTVVAFEELEVEPLPAGGVRQVRRRAAVVLKAAGLRRLGEEVLRYRKDDALSRHQVWTVSAKGVARAADEQDDVTDLPEVATSGYTDARLRIVRVPGLTVGGWVLSESSVVKAMDLGAVGHWFGDAEIPTVLSRVSVRTPPGWSRDWVVRRAPGLHPDLDGQRASFTLRDLPPLAQEPRGPAVRDLLPVVWVRWHSPDGTRGYGGWADLSRWAADLTEPAMSPMGEAVSRAQALQPPSPEGLLPALRAAFAHAAREVRYVAIELGIGGYRPETPARVEASLYGDCKAKATLLRALVQTWGLQTFGVIVGTRSRGEVDPEVPTPAQFDHMIMGVVLPSGIDPGLWAAVDVPDVGRVLFLDPTDSHGDAWELSEEDQGTLALLVHPKAPQLLRLPTQPATAAVESRMLDGKVDGAGAFVEGRIEDRYTGTRASLVRRYYAGASERQHREAVARNVQDTIPGTVVAGYRVEGLQAFADPVREIL